MNKTIPSRHINEPNNWYSYLSFLSQETRQKVIELQTVLKQEIGEGLWISTPETLHITLAELIETKPYPTDKQQLFDDHSETYKKLPAKILRGMQPISVTFNSVHVSQHAVIIKGYDDGSFDKLRAQFVKKLPFPDETKSPPDIIHSTIARFTGEIDMKKLNDIVSAHSFNLEEQVSAFMLVNNLKTPLEEFKILRTYTLRP